MTEFAAGVWLGCGVTLVTLVLFVIVFGERDE